MNRFETLCLKAARERWCWNLACTTCGHGVFRWAFKALSRGLDPTDPSWPVHWGSGQTFTTLGAINGEWPDPRSWPIEAQGALQDAVVGCDVQRLSEIVHFPDWLGYIGLALRYTEKAENSNLALTKHLAPQLMTLVIPGSPADRMLGDIMQSGRSLSWSDLEIVERCYRDPRNHDGAV